MKSLAIALICTLGTVCLGAQAAETMDPGLRSAAKTGIDHSLQYLRQHQAEDGSFSDSVGITGLVLRGFVQSHGTPQPGDAALVDRAVAFMLKHEQPDGAISESKENRTYNTALAIGALAAIKNDKYGTAIAKGRAFLQGQQFDEGEGYTAKHRYYGGIGYGDDGVFPDMANQFIALDALRAASLNPKDPTWKKALIFISRAQNRSESNDQKFAANDGGFIYMPGANVAPFAGTESYGGITAAGLMSLLFAGADRSDPRVVDAYNWIKKNYTLDTNPGTGVKDGIFYYYYAFAQAMSAMGEADVIDGKSQKHNWRNDLVNKLLALQSPDGSWVNKDSPRWMQGNPALVSGWTINALNFALK